jgi:hypothetical protein
MDLEALKDKKEQREWIEAWIQRLEFDLWEA